MELVLADKSSEALGDPGIYHGVPHICVWQQHALYIRSCGLPLCGTSV